MSLQIIDEPLPGVKVVCPDRYEDCRGFFQESYNEALYESIGIKETFVQDNWSSSSFGTVRGLHYQLYAPQGKLVQVVHGEVEDVVVDIRMGSPTFGKSCAIRLSGDKPMQVFIPEGFAHGFAVLSEQAHFMYKCTDFYISADSHGIYWDDDALGIAWPKEVYEGSGPNLSGQDRIWPLLECVSKDLLPTYVDD